MAESTVNSRITNADQLFFLGSQRIIGTQSIVPVNNFAAAPLNYAGIGTKQIHYIPRGEQNTTVSINSLLIIHSYFLSF